MSYFTRWTPMHPGCSADCDDAMEMDSHGEWYHHEELDEAISARDGAINARDARIAELEIERDYWKMQAQLRKATTQIAAPETPSSLEP